MVVEVDQAGWLRQIGKKGRGQMVVVAGADEEYFRLWAAVAGALLQALAKAAPGAFTGPKPQFRAEVEQVQAFGAAAVEQLRDRCLGREAVVEI
ncbi:hypothetical protein D9M71_566250 [compost metagenome]